VSPNQASNGQPVSQTSRQQSQAEQINRKAQAVLDAKNSVIDSIQQIKAVLTEIDNQKEAVLKQIDIEGKATIKEIEKEKMLAMGEIQAALNQITTARDEAIKAIKATKPDAFNRQSDANLEQAATEKTTKKPT
jgi:hypothetical protein